MQTNGLHHVSAVAGDPQANLDFYTGTLGLRFVKRTVNFDDTTTYHLYYGDETGSPGTALTFFPFAGARPGRPGRGQAVATAFAVPDGSLDYWSERLAASPATVGDSLTCFGASVLPFEDPDGQPLELVETDPADSSIEPWTGGPVPEDRAIRGFFGVTLHSAEPDATAKVLELLGFDRVGSEDDDGGERVRYVAAGDHATVVDVLHRHPPRGRPGVGTVHHVAFRAEDEAEQLQWRDRLSEAGQFVTPQKDRQYFQSIYFREPGGILFEIATDGPGFTVDEDVDALGSALKLPEWLAEEREGIEAALPSLDPPESGVDATAGTDASGGEPTVAASETTAPNGGTNR
ncbi:ring-cleaving dioxygenase [Halobellus ordinarius]|uniref:ring-cleaving dioxygenase n=1 Tax=Halobellus ordinarius TaxID=3075120 RepID=UPI002880A879|nr:ring-cleaving dioxygenase [Halobellus sp. ZY16]